MLRITDLKLARGVRVLYSKVNLLANDAERIGLVGPNGSGKSSLLAAILGEAALENGDIAAPLKATIGHVAQDIENIEENAFDWVIKGHAPLIAAKDAVANAKSDMELAAAHAALAELNIGAIEARAHLILHGLGFTGEEETKAVNAFSGGWRNRLALARALMTPSELLLLDEPTNHLDLDSLIWLENFLKRQASTTIIISHDREFLDKIVQTVWSIEDGTIRRYAGNYSDFERLRVERLKLQASQAKAYAEQAKHLQAYIDRFRYKATKARQAQSRIKMLEKLEVIEPVRAFHAWRFSFLKPERIPQHLINVENVTLAYGTTPIIRGASFSIRAMERIGILGVNGAGKSTLIKGLTEDLKPVSGRFYRGQGLKIGYFAQHQLEQLDANLSALAQLRHMTPDAREQDLRDYLGRFQFSGDKIEQACGSFSGGEKARLALALLAWDKPNLLILDEPTNHL
ncbi:MAG TPA: ABC transporter, partial [Sutterella sp.]|nr:ABC transporter [Sutterella sp.]